MTERKFCNMSIICDIASYGIRILISDFHKEGGEELNPLSSHNIPIVTI